MNTGNTAFMMICTALVFFMTPGLAFFYGGLVRRKNVCNTMMACVAIMGLSVLLWTMFGYSLSFGGNHAGIIGDFNELHVNQVAAEAAEGTAEADISTAEAGESVPAGQEEPELPQPPETQNGEGGETDGNTH